MESKIYYELKAKGICTCCGKARAADGRTICRQCSDNHKKNIYCSLDKAVKRQGKKEGYSIEDIDRMSRERGVSYGVMVAILDGTMKDPLTND